MSASIGRLLGEPPGNTGSGGGHSINFEKRSRPMTKERLQGMIKHNQWDLIGKIFKFTPRFHFSGNWIDWRCVPQSVTDLLGLKSEKVDLRSAKEGFRHGRKCKPNGGSTSSVLYDNQKGVCYYCEVKTNRGDWTIDHKIPTSRGGSNAFFNKVGCCRRCNGSKSCLTDEEFTSLAPMEPGIEERSKEAVKFIIAKYGPTIRSESNHTPIRM